MVKWKARGCGIQEIGSDVIIVATFLTFLRAYSPSFSAIHMFRSILQFWCSLHFLAAAVRRPAVRHEPPHALHVLLRLRRQVDARAPARL